jgi:predicted transcriptional regulator
VRPHKYEIVEKLLYDLNLDDLDIELIRTQLFTTNPKLERKELAERYKVSRQAVDQRLLKLIRRLAGMYQLDPIRSLVRSIRSRAIGGDTFWYLDVRDQIVQFIEFDCRGEFPQPIDLIGFGVWLSQMELEDPYIEQSMTEPALAKPTHWVRDMGGTLGVSGSQFELAIHPGDEVII